MSQPPCPPLHSSPIAVPYETTAPRRCIDCEVGGIPVGYLCPHLRYPVVNSDQDFVTRRQSAPTQRIDQAPSPFVLPHNTHGNGFGGSYARRDISIALGIGAAASNEHERAELNQAARPSFGLQNYSNGNTLGGSYRSRDTSIAPVHHTAVYSGPLSSLQSQSQLQRIQQRGMQVAQTKQTKKATAPTNLASSAAMAHSSLAPTAVMKKDRLGRIASALARDLPAPSPRTPGVFASPGWPHHRLAPRNSAAPKPLFPDESVFEVMAGGESRPPEVSRPVVPSMRPNPIFSSTGDQFIRPPLDSSSTDLESPAPFQFIDRSRLPSQNPISFQTAPYSPFAPIATSTPVPHPLPQSRAPVPSPLSHVLFPVSPAVSPTVPNPAPISFSIAHLMTAPPVAPRPLPNATPSLLPLTSTPNTAKKAVDAVDALIDRFTREKTPPAPRDELADRRCPCGRILINARGRKIHQDYMRRKGTPCVSRHDQPAPVARVPDAAPIQMTRITIVQTTTCQPCGRTFKNVGGYKVHVKRIHKGSLAGAAVAAIGSLRAATAECTCQICGLIAKTPSGLKTHQRIKHKDMVAAPVPAVVSAAVASPRAVVLWDKKEVRPAEHKAFSMKTTAFMESAPRNVEPRMRRHSLTFDCLMKGTPDEPITLTRVVTTEEILLDEE